MISMESIVPYLVIGSRRKINRRTSVSAVLVAVGRLSSTSERVSECKGFDFK